MMTKFILWHTLGPPLGSLGIPSRSRGKNIIVEWLEPKSFIIWLNVYFGTLWETLLRLWVKEVIRHPFPLFLVSLPTAWPIRCLHWICYVTQWPEFGSSRFLGWLLHPTGFALNKIKTNFKLVRLGCRTAQVAYSVQALIGHAVGSAH